MAVTPQTPKCHHNLGCASVVMTFGSQWCHGHDRKRSINSSNQTGCLSEYPVVEYDSSIHTVSWWLTANKASIHHIIGPLWPKATNRSQNQNPVNAEIISMPSNNRVAVIIKLMWDHCNIFRIDDIEDIKRELQQHGVAVVTGVVDPGKCEDLKIEYRLWLMKFGRWHHRHLCFMLSS